jgi:phosphatidate cytidylyltransferase
MTRILSALVLLPLVVGAIWFLPPVATLVLALIASVLAFVEYAAIAEALGARIPRTTSGLAVAAACLGTVMVGRPSAMVMHGSASLSDAVPLAAGVLEVVLMSALIVIGATAVASQRPGPDVLRDAAASLFPAIYIGMPLGALAAIRADWLVGGGREALLLLMAVIVVSDSAQYYTGRAFGRRPLSPTISPKKTVEGAVGGVVFGTIAMMVGGWWIFATPRWSLAIVGAVIALLGIVGDLFESLLKRSAGLKDSSQLIPGHGGVLDRIDSWLFAAPVYYVFVRFFAVKL